MPIKLYFALLVACFLTFCSSSSLLAQNTFAPINQRSSFAPPSTWETQVETGLFIYGYRRDLFQDFSGFEAFNESISPQSYGTHGAISVLKSLPLQYLQAVGLQAEYDYLASNSHIAITKPATVPDMTLRIHIATLGFKFFLFSPKGSKPLYPFVGSYWGILHGKFKGTRPLSDENVNSSFNGLITEQSIGVQVPIYKNILGLSFEIRNAYARKLHVHNNIFNTLLPTTDPTTPTIPTPTTTSTTNPTNKTNKTTKTGTSTDPIADIPQYQDKKGLNTLDGSALILVAHVYYSFM